MHLNHDHLALKGAIGKEELQNKLQNFLKVGLSRDNQDEEKIEVWLFAMDGQQDE